LGYEGYTVYNRDSVDDKFGDEWPEAISYEEWCNQNGCMDKYEDWKSLPESDYQNPSRFDPQYGKYCSSLNPILHKTKDGRRMCFGEYGGDVKRFKIKPSQRVLYAVKEIHAQIRNLANKTIIE
jgi:hypothetical protein